MRRGAPCAEKSEDYRVAVRMLRWQPVPECVPVPSSLRWNEWKLQQGSATALAARAMLGFAQKKFYSEKPAGGTFRANDARLGEAREGIKNANPALVPVWYAEKRNAEKICRQFEFDPTRHRSCAVPSAPTPRSGRR